MDKISVKRKMVFRAKIFYFSLVSTINNKTFTFNAISRKSLFGNVIFRPIN